MNRFVLLRVVATWLFLASAIIAYNAGLASMLWAWPLTGVWLMLYVGCVVGEIAAVTRGFPAGWLPGSR